MPKNEQIEKYAKLIEKLSEEQAKECLGLFVEMIADPDNAHNITPKINKIITQSKNECTEKVIVFKNFNDFIGCTDLKNYDKVIFDCDVKFGYTRGREAYLGHDSLYDSSLKIQLGPDAHCLKLFQTCPEKIIFNKNLEFHNQKMSAFHESLSKAVVMGDLCFEGCVIQSFKNCPEVRGNVIAPFSNIGTLKGLKKVGGRLDLEHAFSVEEIDDNFPKEVGGLIMLRTGFYDNKERAYICRNGEYIDIYNLPKDETFVTSGLLSFDQFKPTPDLSSIVTFNGNIDIIGDNDISSFSMLPRNINGNLWISDCKNLKSAEYLPNVSGKIECRGDARLRSLIEKELKKRENIRKTSSVFMKKFVNDGNGGM